MTWRYLGPPLDPIDTKESVAAATFCAVIVVHNMAQFLPEALDSVFGQTRDADQVIVCDDASDDNIDVALAPYRSRIELIRRASRGGEGTARNAALARTSCTYLATLDGDDVWHPQRLEAFHEVVTARPDFDIVASDLEEFGPEARPSPPAEDTFPTQDQRDLILERNFLPAPALKVAALLGVGGFDGELSYGPDWECYARMLCRGARAALVPDRLYFYRRWRGQQSADGGRVLLGNISVLRKIAEDPHLTKPRTHRLLAPRARSGRGGARPHSAYRTTPRDAAEDASVRRAGDAFADARYVDLCGEIRDLANTTTQISTTAAMFASEIRRLAQLFASSSGVVRPNAATTTTGASRRSAPFT
jgi:Glycosyl transferase family 2